ncbi:adenylate/guanylate cyclase domain-containing protein [Ruegeria arenilitoris]|uniref:adenylate/guanylate cyclase domain-containing protein n=1 Tax=Ruegeria arenilitoris TaxID=1173585 RepID=UPI00147DFF29|nr:adenylate/guanylate cyclase domain-containing protein [Ruegeria arenilitoris]
MWEQSKKESRQSNLIVRIVAKAALSVRSKLLVALLGITLLLLGLALFAMAALQESNKRVDAMIHDQERIAYFNEIHLALSELNLMNLSLIIDQTPGGGSDEIFTFSSGAFTGQIENLQHHIAQGIRRFVQAGSKEARTIDVIRTELSDIKTKAVAMLRFRKDGYMQNVVELGLDQIFRRIRSLQDDAYTLVQSAEKEMSNRAIRNTEVYQSTRKMVVIAAAIAMGSALFLGYAISSSLIWPMRRIGQTLSVVAKGDFSARVNVPNRDELGKLANDVNATSERLGNLYETVEAQRAELEAEYIRSEKLLYNLLPEDIAARLKVDPNQTIADKLPNVAILFADVVDFTPRASNLPPEEVVGFLNTIFRVFDELADKHGLEKIKTIGDAYMVAAGMPSPVGDPVRRIADMALDVQRVVADMSTDFPDGLQVRIGLHAGPAVAGVIGNQKLFYDVWGETVNTASRMESHGEPGKIQVTGAVREKLQADYEFEPRAVVEVKGIGAVETWFLTGAKAKI